ncbi:MAG: hypothetical protein IIY89_04970, partial [Clostridia bacterium]|nr:hypothetical protein [Clostridia bacterium]
LTLCRSLLLIIYTNPHHYKPKDDFWQALFYFFDLEQITGVLDEKYNIIPTVFFQKQLYKRCFFCYNYLKQ